MVISRLNEGRSAVSHRRRMRGRALAAHGLEPCEPRLLLSALPAGMRAWETVPGVIRNDGIETFVVEIQPGTTIDRITFANTTHYLTPPATNQLLDDGAGRDRVAGDGIYTSGAFKFKTSSAAAMPATYRGDPNSPAGLHTTYVAEFNTHHTDGTTTRFLEQPSVALLDKNIPAVRGQSLAPGLVATPHLVNIQGANKDTQKFIRSKSTNLADLTRRIYDVLGDDYDFLMFVSTYKLEDQNWTQRENFTAGIHSSIQVNYGGTGQGQYDASGVYGSEGRLLGLNILDTYDRGMLSYNAVHELLHQWGAYAATSLGLASGAHYNINTSVGSILGGKMWVPNGDGSFTLNDEEGAGAGGHHAAPLDLYLMGLIEAGELPPIHVADPAMFDYVKKLQGEPITAAEIIRTVTADDIIALHGPRTPAPAQAKKDFRMAFVAESNGRLLNPTELTYYEIMAAHFTKELPQDQPDPHVEHNWAPITRFFGHGTTWRSDLALPEPEKFSVAGVAYLDRNANGLREPDEKGLSPRTIFIDLDNDRVLDSNERRVTTAADGSWSLADLDPGTYRICQVSVNGFTLTAPTDRCHTVALVGAGLADVDFGSFPTRIEGTAGDDHFYLRRDPAGSIIEIYLDGLAARPDYTMPPTAIPALQLLGGDGDDLLTVDFANGNPFPTFALLFFGDGDTAITGGSGDRLEVLGAGQTFGSGQSAITHDGKGVGYNLLEQVIIKDGTFDFTTPVPLTGLHVDASANASFSGLQVFTTLKLDGPARVVPGTNAVLFSTGGVTIADDVALDLQDSDLVVAVPPDTRQAVLDLLAALVRRARGAPTPWRGPGLTSERAAANPLLTLAVVPNDDGSGTPLIVNHPLLRGAALTTDMVIVRVTYHGDSNLDGRVNADDYFRIDSGFLAQPPDAAYRDGDLNYDGRINADDYFLIDSAFLGQSAALASRTALATASPSEREPSTTRKKRVVKRKAPIRARVGRA